MSEKRDRSGAVWCCLRPSFYIGSLGAARAPHSRHTSNSTTCTRDSCYRSRTARSVKGTPARALLVLNPAGSTSSARSGSGGSFLGGRCPGCLDPCTREHRALQTYSKHWARTACRACLGGGRFPRTPFAVPNKGSTARRTWSSPQKTRVLTLCVCVQPVAHLSGGGKGK